MFFPIAENAVNLMYYNHLYIYFPLIKNSQKYSELNNANYKFVSYFERTTA
jgi:hypothetical protein